MLILKFLYVIWFYLRYLTVFKKEGSTIVAKDAFLDLSPGSQRLISSLFAR